MAVMALERAAAHAVVPHVGPELRSTERWISGLTGGALITAALVRPGGWSLLKLALGGYGLYRATTGRCPVTRSLAIGRGMGTRKEPIQTFATITVGGDPDMLFDRWRDVARWPEWMRFVSAAARENGNVRFEITTPEDLGHTPIVIEGSFVEHPAERLLRFVSADGAPIYFASTIRFVAAPDLRSTEIHVDAEYAIPGGKIGAGMSSLFGGAPDQQIRSDLRRFKAWVETAAVPTTLGQPSGARKGPITRIARVRERLEQGAPLALSEPAQEGEELIELIEVIEIPIEVAS
jgi:uncharacterized membrane protein